MRSATSFILAAVVAISTSASLVVRQSFPTCYETCVAEANIGSCNSSDIKCLCENSVFVSETTTCVESVCQGSDLTQALADGRAVCASVGVTFTTSSGPSTVTVTVSSSTPTSPFSSNNLAAAHGPNAFIGLAIVGLVVLAL